MARTIEYNWVFGHGDHFEFKQNGQDLHYLTAQASMIPYQGSATISDQNGDLIAYSDGVRLWDSIGTAVPLSGPILGTTNGQLGGDNSSCHSCIFVPPAGGGSHYHIFTTPSIEDNNSSAGTGKQVYHSTFSVNGPTVSQEISATDITSSLPPVGQVGPGLFRSTERIAATSHVDCDKYWVVTQRHGLGINGGFHAFLVDSDQTPTFSQFSPESVVREGADGSMKFSPNGKFLAYSVRAPGSNTAGKIYVFEFDRSTGILTYSFVVSEIPDPYGLEFSPNSEFIYFGDTENGDIYGHPITNGSGAQTALVFSHTDVSKIYAMQLGPNNIIYAKTNTRHLVEIGQSNDIATASPQYPAGDYNGDAITLRPNQGNRLGLPTFTTVARDCLKPGCDLSLVSQDCDHDGNTKLIIEMTNNSANNSANLTLELSGIPESMYSLSTTNSGQTYTTEISIDGIFQGSITVKGHLGGFTGNSGTGICCAREIDIEIASCSPDCLKVEGMWGRFVPLGTWIYWFWVTNISTNSSFIPSSVSVTNLPAGASISQDPVPFVNGMASGAIILVPGTRNDVDGFLFHAEDMDMCCNKWVQV